MFFFVLCTLCCQFLWILPFKIAPSVFSYVYFPQLSKMQPPPTQPAEQICYKTPSNHEWLCVNDSVPLKKLQCSKSNLYIYHWYLVDWKSIHDFIFRVGSSSKTTKYIKNEYSILLIDWQLGNKERESIYIVYKL